MQTLAIVGASLAGISAARAARIQGFTGRMIIIGEEDERPYDRPPLSKEFLAGKITAADLSLETGRGDAGEDPLNAEWVLGSKAVALDPGTRTITLKDRRTVQADGVVLATGASARTLPELAGLANVFTLRTLDDARALAPELVPGGRLLVIGAGFVGCEVASTAKGLGMEVTVVCAAEIPLSGPLGARMGAAVARLHEINGVELLCGTGVDSFYTRESNVAGVRLDNGRYLPADVVLVGIGAEPNTGWLKGSGIGLDNGVLCDESGRTTAPGIVSVGDCAAWLDLGSGSHRRVEHWSAAMERPAVAVAALLTPDAVRPPVSLPYFWSDQYGVKLQFAGSAQEADRVDVEAGDPAGHNFLAVYYRGADPVGVLGLNQPRLFTKWRRALNARTVVPQPSLVTL